MKRIRQILELNLYACASLAAYSLIRDNWWISGEEKVLVSTFAFIPAYVPFYVVRHILPARCPACGTRTLDHARAYALPTPLIRQTRWCRNCGRTFRGYPGREWRYDPPSGP
ncbi:hypothetical protein OJF2_10140 [Aquisphaera giovannonii]|uniref:Uncharacterized protein n=1 Tax=Aquisphaera giovannonii TaxID=406548 RepID=A0A5B9VX59_9BACT|nr:hypothetical protein [Aquisphaera giovannonii]QEH32537.1 hypothetical protein OJF2_10140 [Aquisphaera giovannonii]